MKTLFICIICILFLNNCTKPNLNNDKNQRTGSFSAIIYNNGLDKYSILDGKFTSSDLADIYISFYNMNSKSWRIDALNNAGIRLVENQETTAPYTNYDGSGVFDYCTSLKFWILCMDGIHYAKLETKTKHLVDNQIPYIFPEHILFGWFNDSGDTCFVLKKDNTLSISEFENDIPFETYSSSSIKAKTIGLNQLYTLLSRLFVGQKWQFKGSFNWSGTSYTIPTELRTIISTYYSELQNRYISILDTVDFSYTINLDANDNDF